MKNWITISAIVVAIALGGTALSQTQATPNLSQPGKIKSIKIDQTLLTLPCRDGAEPCGGEPSSTFLVNVELESYKIDKKISYQYFATAGRIIGQGKKVVWDLSNIAPGSYWIGVKAMRNGKLVDEFRSEAVNIVSAICICDCLSCPMIRIYVTNRTISAGETVSASATISGGSQSDPLTLNWTTTVGEIVSGQGTNAITVRAPPQINANELVVTLTIGGLDRRCSCATSESETIRLKR